MNLTKLVMTAVDNDKINEKEAIALLSMNIEDGVDSCEAFKKFYKKAYGDDVAIPKDFAEDIVKGMAVTDNSERVNGQKWTMDQTTAVGSEIGVDWNKIPKTNFYIAMNMMYSDYHTVAEKVEYEDDPKFYAYLAKDFLCDKDAPLDKLQKYIFSIILA